MSRVDGEPGFLLHLRPYRETSALVDVFSLEHGRFTAVAKGVRGGGRGRQGWRSALQPFNLLALSWQGRGELKSLSDAQLQQAYPLAGRPLFCGFYLNELLERLLHRFDPHPETFHHYRYCLQQLQAGETEAVCLRRFELQLLGELGYGFSLSHDGGGVAIDPGQGYQFYPEQGFVPAARPSDEVYLGADLLALGRGEFAGGAGRAARLLFRAVTTPLLGNRPLRSRELFASLFANDSAAEDHR